MMNRIWYMLVMVIAFVCLANGCNRENTEQAVVTNSDSDTSILFQQIDWTGYVEETSLRKFATEIKPLMTLRDVQLMVGCKPYMGSSPIVHYFDKIGNKLNLLLRWDMDIQDYRIQTVEYVEKL